jgi:Sulfatase-modifying factor enzyme 1
MIVLWSSQAEASPWVDQEIRGYSGPILFILMDGTPPRHCGSDYQQCRLAKKTDAIGALRSLLAETATSGATESDCQPPRAEDQALFNARREQTQSASARLRLLLKGIRRPPMLSPTQNGDFAINQWDGSILRRISADKDSRVYVATEPVTNQQYERFLRGWKLDPPRTWERQEFRVLALPVVGVTWFEAVLYAAWVGGGLPTESQWMRAANLSKPEAIFATATGDIDPQLAYYDCRLGNGSPVAATSFAATPGGYYGMCGNTWDWCDSDDATYKIIKGGGYCDSAFFCRIEARYRNSPLDRDCTVGFRIKVVEDNESLS